MPTIKQLKLTCKNKRRDPFYSFVDYLAYYPAKLFLYTPITPNQITVIWIIGQIISTFFIMSGDIHTMIIALVAFQFMFVLDCSDGIVARYKKKFSLNGIYLDHLGHYLCNPLLLISFGIGTYKIYGEEIYLFLGLAAAIFFLLNKSITLNPSWYSKDKQEKIISNSKSSMLKNERSIFYFAFALFRLEYFFNFMFWGLILNLANYTLIIYSLLFFLELLRKILKQYLVNKKYD